jgi:hypothetical protein
MSGPILITVGNLLRKTHNRLALRPRRSTRHEAMAYINSGCPSDHGYVPATNLILERRLLPHLKDSPNWTVLPGPHQGEK